MIDRMISDKHLDNEAAISLMETFGDEYSGLINEFLAILPTHLEHLKEAVKTRSDDQIYKVSHTVKGMAGNLGFLSFSKICEHVEIAARTGAIVDYENLLRDLEITASKLTAYRST